MRRGQLERGVPVPGGLSLPGLQLVPLTEALAALDYAAVRESDDRLRAQFPEWRAPADIEAARAQIRAHQRDAAERTAFTYSALDPTGARCLGCVYLYVLEDCPYDVLLYAWVRAGHESLDAALFGALLSWIERDWPFTAPIAPGRTHGWGEWQALVASGTAG